MPRKKSSPKKTFLVLGIIEVVLALIAVAISVEANTDGVDDWSGLGVLYPIIGMFIVGIIGLVLLVTSNPAGSESTPVKPAHNFAKAAAIFLLGLSVPYFVLIYMGILYAAILLVFLIALATYKFVSPRLGASRTPFQILLVAFAPLIGILYMFDENNTMPFLWMWATLIIFAFGLIRILQNRK